MRKNEHLSSPEMSPSARAKKMQEPSRLTVADAEHMEAERNEMLGVVEEYLSEPFQKTIREKIEQEKESLLAFIVREKQIQDAARKIIRVLDPTYFVHKPLDKTMFE